MPSLSTLVDNFNDSIIGPDWGNSYGGVSETGGRARVPCTTTQAGYETGFAWTFGGSSLYVKVPTIPAASTATTANCSVFVDAPDVATSGNRVGFTIKAVAGVLRMQSDTGFTDAGAVEITYNATTHAFLRLREDGVNVYWDTSPDGTTWTNQRTLASPAWIAASSEQCAVELAAYRDAGTSDYAEFDLFNTLADGAVYTGSGSGVAQSAATATGSRIAVASGSGTAQTSVGANAVGVYHASGSGAAQTDALAVTAPEYPEVAGLAAGDFDLYIEQGATFVQTYTVSDPGFSWAGWSARAQIRTAADENATLLLDLTSYLTISGAAIQLAIPAAVTQTLTKNGRWDLEVYQGVIVVRILQGKVIVSPEVTR